MHIALFTAAGHDVQLALSLLFKSKKSPKPGLDKERVEPFTPTPIPPKMNVNVGCVK